jgi:hypothetical protein
MLGLESFGQCNQSFFRKRLVADWWSMSLSQMIRRPFTEGQLDQPGRYTLKMVANRLLIDANAPDC